MRDAHRLAIHEERDVHLQAKQHQDELAAADGIPSDLPLSAFVVDGVRNLLGSLAAPSGYSRETQSNYTESRPLLPPAPLLDWGLSENTELDPSPEARAVAHIAEQLSHYFDMDPDSDNEVDERSDDDSDNDETQEPTVTGMLTACGFSLTAHLIIKWTTAMRMSPTVRSGHAPEIKPSIHASGTHGQTGL